MAGYKARYSQNKRVQQRRHAIKRSLRRTAFARSCGLAPASKVLLLVRERPWPTHRGGVLNDTS
jgi:hypothetical protein